MAGKTHGEKIDELAYLTARLTERLDHVHEAIKNSRPEHEQLSRSHQELARAVAVIEERLNELKRTVEESGRRRWSLFPVLLTGLLGLIGGVIAILAKWLLDYFTRP